MCSVISHYQTNTRITILILDINEHLKLSPLVELAQIPELLEGQTQKIQEELGQIIKESIEALASPGTSASTSQGVPASTGSVKMNLIYNPLIVGQENAYAFVENSLINDGEAKNIGFLGKVRSGKILLLNTLFNSEN